MRDVLPDEFLTAIAPNPEAIKARQGQIAENVAGEPFIASVQSHPDVIERKAAWFDQHLRPQPFCWRVGIEVDLEPSRRDPGMLVCPECGWRKPAPTVMERIADAKDDL